MLRTAAPAVAALAVTAASFCYFHLNYRTSSRQPPETKQFGLWSLSTAFFPNKPGTVWGFCVESLAWPLNEGDTEMVTCYHQCVAANANGHKPYRGERVSVNLPKVDAECRVFKEQSKTKKRI